MDGSNLVIIDTDVSRVVELLRESRIAATHATRPGWIREHARALDRQEFDADLAVFSPRLVKKALNAFLREVQPNCRDRRLRAGLCCLQSLRAAPVSL